MVPRSQARFQASPILVRAHTRWEWRERSPEFKPFAKRQLAHFARREDKVFIAMALDEYSKMPWEWDTGPDDVDYVEPYDPQLGDDFWESESAYNSFDPDDRVDEDWDIFEEEWYVRRETYCRCDICKGA